MQGILNGNADLEHFLNSESQVKTAVNYVLNQRAHHEKKTFREEYIELLEQFEIEFDNKYLFEFLD